MKLPTEKVEVITVLVLLVDVVQCIETPESFFTGIGNEIAKRVLGMPELLKDPVKAMKPVKNILSGGCFIDNKSRQLFEEWAQMPGIWKKRLEKKWQERWMNDKKPDAKDESTTAAPLMDAPFMGAPSMNAPLKDAILKNAPVNYEPLIDAPLIDVPLKDAPLEDAPLEDAPLIEAYIKQATVNDAPKKKLCLTDLLNKNVEKIAKWKKWQQFQSKDYELDELQ